MQAKERNELIISWLTISLAFAWISTSEIGLVFAMITGFPKILLTDFVVALMSSLIIVGTAFVFHELGHRQVAKKYGCHAEYRMWAPLLLFMIVIAIFARVIFAAPGAVYIYGKNLTRREEGIISLAGPATNILVAILLIGIFFAMIFFGMVNNFILVLLLEGAYINLYFAAFNLLPIFILDGAKVFAWNPAIWAIFFIPAAIPTFFLPYLI